MCSHMLKGALLTPRDATSSLGGIFFGGSEIEEYHLKTLNFDLQMVSSISAQSIRIIPNIFGATRESQ